MIFCAMSYISVVTYLPLSVFTGLSFNVWSLNLLYGWPDDLGLATRCFSWFDIFIWQFLACFKTSSQSTSE